MAKQGVTKIDIKQVLAQKAPKASRKIPGFIVDYLIRTVHQEELNDILTRYHDKEGVDFMRELIGYFDLTLDLVHAENIPTEGRYIFASNHPLGGLDGICLSAVIGSRFEGRIKYPVNDLLLYLCTDQQTRHPRKGQRTDAGGGFCLGRPDHHFPRWIMLSQDWWQDTRLGVEEIVHPEGGAIQAGYRTGLFRREEFQFLLQPRPDTQGVGYKDEL